MDNTLSSRSCLYRWGRILSSAVVGVTPGFGKQKLETPVVVATQTNNSEILLDWEPIPEAVSYEVYHSTDNVNFVLIGTTDSLTTEFPDNPTFEQDHYYHVIAVSDPNDTTKQNSDPGQIGITPIYNFNHLVEFSNLQLYIDDLNVETSELIPFYVDENQLIDNDLYQPYPNIHLLKTLLESIDNHYKIQISHNNLPGIKTISIENYDLFFQFKLIGINGDSNTTVDSIDFVQNQFFENFTISGAKVLNTAFIVNLNATQLNRFQYSIIGTVFKTLTTLVRDNGLCIISGSTHPEPIDFSQAYFNEYDFFYLSNNGYNQFIMPPLNYMKKFVSSRFKDWSVQNTINIDNGIMEHFSITHCYNLITGIQNNLIYLSFNYSYVENVVFTAPALINFYATNSRFGSKNNRLNRNYFDFLNSFVNTYHLQNLILIGSYLNVDDIIDLLQGLDNRKNNQISVCSVDLRGQSTGFENATFHNTRIIKQAQLDLIESLIASGKYNFLYDKVHGKIVYIDGTKSKLELNYDSSNVDFVLLNSVLIDISFLQLSGNAFPIPVAPASCNVVTVTDLYNFEIDLVLDPGTSFTIQFNVQ